MKSTSKVNTQTRETARKAREIRRLKSAGNTWEEIARELGVLTKEGKPDPGLAYKIGFEGYEPKRPETRERLGLRKICSACMRGFRTVTRAADLAPWLAWWKRLPKEERDRRIRKEYEERK